MDLVTNKISNISFQKRLVGTCTIGANSPINIFYLDGNKINNRTEIKKDRFVLDNADCYYKEGITHEYIENNNDTYSFETDDGTCVGLISVMKERTKNNSRNLLDYICTCGDLDECHRPKNRIKYLGESMMTFLAKLCLEDKVDLEIPLISKDAPDFYKKCGCKVQEIPEEVEECNHKGILPLISWDESGTLESLISQNEFHKCHINLNI